MAEGMPPLLLYPSDEAVQGTEMRGQVQDWICRRLEKSASSSAEGAEETAIKPVLSIVVLDGTWSEANRMRKRMPPQLWPVKIQPAAVSNYQFRKQTQPDRICTLEAAAALLEELNVGRSERLYDALGILHARVSEAHGPHC